MQHPRKQTARTLALLVERRGGVPVGVTVTGTQNQTATGGLLCRLCTRFEATNAQQLNRGPATAHWLGGDSDGLLLEAQAI
jgi:hypothetical protein